MRPAKEGVAKLSAQKHKANRPMSFRARSTAARYGLSSRGAIRKTKCFQLAFGDGSAPAGDRTSCTETETTGRSSNAVRMTAVKW